MLLTVLKRWPWCCSYSVWLCGLYYVALHVLMSPCAVCPRVSSFRLALWSSRLGKRELVYVALVYLFVLYVLVFYPFFFSFSWCRLRFVIVALPWVGFVADFGSIYAPCKLAGYQLREQDSSPTRQFKDTERVVKTKTPHMNESGVSHLVYIFPLHN